MVFSLLTDRRCVECASFLSNAGALAFGDYTPISTRQNTALYRCGSSYCLRYGGRLKCDRTSIRRSERVVSVCFRDSHQCPYLRPLAVTRPRIDRDIRDLDRLSNGG